jgi:hypothetical protein
MRWFRKGYTGSQCINDLDALIDGHTTLRAMGVFKDWRKLRRAVKQQEKMDKALRRNNPSKL